MEGPLTIKVYSRQGCHLCDIAIHTLKEYIEKRVEIPIELKVIDIDLDQELKNRFNDLVPVIFIEDELFDYYGVNLEEFENKLNKFI